MSLKDIHYNEILYNYDEMRTKRMRQVLQKFTPRCKTALYHYKTVGIRIYLAEYY